MQRVTAARKAKDIQMALRAGTHAAVRSANNEQESLVTPNCLTAKGEESIYEEPKFVGTQH